MLTLAGSCAGRAADIPAGLTGLWEFDDPLDPGRASHGAALVIVGTPPTHAASLTDAQASPYTLTGVVTTHLGLHHLEAAHEIAANGGGARVNQYTPGTGNVLRHVFRSPEPGLRRHLASTK